MIDLHAHTTYSDGTFSVKELLIKAEEIGLSVLSITDHNTVDAYYELQNSSIRNLYSGTIINGCEVSTTYNKECIEILAFDFDIDIMNFLLSQNILSFEERTKEEYELIKRKFYELGIKYNINNITYNPKIESSKKYFHKEFIKDPNNFKTLLFPENTSRVSFTRNEIYNPKSILYIDQTHLYPSLEKTISMIHEAKGLAFLAHTFEYSPNIAKDLHLIVKKYNLDGLECLYTKFTKEQTKFIVNFCF